MGKSQRRAQASKKVRGQGPDHVGRAFIELRKGSRAQPHKNKYRDQKVRGWDWE